MEGTLPAAIWDSTASCMSCTDDAQSDVADPSAVGPPGGAPQSQTYLCAHRMNHQVILNRVECDTVTSHTKISIPDEIMTGNDTRDAQSGYLGQMRTGRISPPSAHSSPE